MFRKLLVISALCVGLMIMGFQEANAFRLAGFSFSPGGSVYCDSLWKGVGNLTKEDVYAEVKCIIEPQEVQVLCMNPGGNTGGIGNPFETSSVIELSDVLNAEALTAFSEIYFSDEVLWNALFPEGYEFPPETCDQNDNWGVISVDDGGIVIIVETLVTVEGYSDGGVLEDSDTYSCTLNPAGDEYLCN